MNSRTIIRTLDVAAPDLPLALAKVHGALPVGARWEARLRAGDAHAVRSIVEGGGFAVRACTPTRTGEVSVEAERLRTLPDFVGPDLGLLLVGLNPSLYAADAGVGFARPGNRFWPAARAAGVVTCDRDPWHVVRVDRVGMTDLVKRASVGAAELTAAEYRQGLARVTRVVEWLRPKGVCFLGLAGWRAAVDRTAVAGPQESTLGGVDVYVMPNPSGLNAHETVETLTAHLRAALALTQT